MSLKAFHLVFIVLAIVLAGGVGVWAWGHRAAGGTLYQGLAVVCFLAAAALVVYGIWFVKKLKDVSYL